MKRSALMNTVAVLLGTATSALAASGAREDNSNIFVWIFLGFCALIVVVQLLPAVMMMLGFAKGIKREKEAPVEQSSH